MCSLIYNKSIENWLKIAYISYSSLIPPPLRIYYLFKFAVFAQ